MDNQKLRQLIARKNEQLEEQTANRARQIIDEISSLQQAKKDADTEIAKLRSELRGLQVTQLDETSILGE